MRNSRFWVFQFKTWCIFLVQNEGGTCIKKAAYIRRNTVCAKNLPLGHVVQFELPPSEYVPEPQSDAVDAPGH